MLSSLARRLAIGAIACTALTSTALAQGGNVVISQVYGGGGFQPSGPKYDLVELFNRTNAPINLAGWSVQVGTSTLTWSVVPLTGTIPARGYYLVRTGETFSATVGIDLTYDDSASPLLGVSDFTSPNGRVALANDSIAIPSGTCAVGQPNVIDYVQWGTASTCFEGTGPAPAGSTSVDPPTNIVRRLNGCQDSNDNSADWVTQTPPNFRNSTSPPQSSLDFLVATSSLGIVPAGGSVTLTANMQACGGIPVAITGVSANLVAFGLSAAEAFSTASPPSAGPWTYVLNVPLAQPAGPASVNLTGTDGVNNYTTTVNFTITPPAPSNDTCAGAVLLTSLPQTYGVDISGATSDLDPGTCNTGTVGNFGVWYRYDATMTGTLNLNETSAVTVAWGIWETPTSGATCPSTSPANTCSTTQNLTISVTAGNTYFIQVGQSGTALPTAPISFTATFNTGPVNDNCSGAIALTSLPQTVTATIAAAGSDIDPGTCNTGTVGNFGVWYRYDATQTGVLNLNESSTVTVAWGIWETPTSGATCPTTSPANFCSTTQNFSFSVFAGNTYFIQAGQSGTATPTTDISFVATFIPAPSNDTCANAIPLTSLPQTYNPDITGATSDLDPGTCNTGTVGNFGVWYRYDATVTGTLNLNETSAVTVAWGIWETPTSGATCPSTSPATICSTTQNLNVTVIAGNTYYIQTGQSGTGTPTAALAFTATFTPPPANDECAAAVAVSANAPFTMNNASATASAAPLNSVPCPTAASAFFADVWYKWTAPASGRFVLITNVGTSGRHAIYDGGPGGGTCPTTATPIGCASTATAVSNSTTTPLLAVAGNTYYIQFGATTSTATTGGVEAEIQFDPDPTGACCIGANCVIAAQSVCTTLTGTYQGDASVCSPATATVNTYAGTGGAIPDFANNTVGVFTSSVNVADTFTVAGVALDIDLNHTFNGDLIIRLAKSGGPSFIVHYRGRRGVSGTTNTGANFAGLYTFSDSASQSVIDTLASGTITDIALGSYKPSGTAGINGGFTEAFNGVSAAGTWTLTITDNAGGDAGTLNAWALKLTQGSAGPCNAAPTGRCCVGSRCTIVTQTNCVTGGGAAGTAFTASASDCNATGILNTPCCFADYNKVGGVSVQDIFDFLTAYFSGGC